MKVIKRDGSEVEFDANKIFNAVSAASESAPLGSRMEKFLVAGFTKEICKQCRKLKYNPSVEEIQNMIENELMRTKNYDIARNYITYRYKRSEARNENTTDKYILALIEDDNEEIKQENSNKNPTVCSVQRDYMAGEVSKDLTKRKLLPKHIIDAHEQGIIHFHDMDYFAQHIHNCDLVNLEDMLQNGTVISGTMIEKPHTFSTACNIATQIIAQVASSQYGGQSISLTHLAPFVNETRLKYKNKYKDVSDEFIEELVQEDIVRGVQTIQYQVVTLMTTNGQAPFVTLFMYLNEAGKDEQLKADLARVIEEVLKQRIQGVKNEKGVWITPAFPKLIYVLEDDNIVESSPYWYLTELAAKCTAKRMVPDYISEKIMLKNKIDANGHGHCYTCMGCRSFLTPYINPITKKFQVYGRFNQGVVTINLVDVALTAKQDNMDFWRVLDERLELCHEALQYRHERLEGTVSDTAPILWQYGALARLSKGEKIDRLLHGGYSTISLGYAGLWECVLAVTGHKLTEPEGEEFGMQVMKELNLYTNKWKTAEDIDYSLYGTPLESTTYKFAKCLQRKFGAIPGITDRNYITNSYHVHVAEPIDAFSKLELESKFQALSPGGAISYVEVPNLQNNIPAVLTVMQYIYQHIMYAELNTKSDYCQECGYDGEIKIVDTGDKLVWECPNCGNRDQNKMNVARRTCGYIGSQFWNQGRTQEIKDRVLHL